jgi:hypothetical protein
MRRLAFHRLIWAAAGHQLDLTHLTYPLAGVWGAHTDARIGSNDANASRAFGESGLSVNGFGTHVSVLSDSFNNLGSGKRSVTASCYFRPVCLTCGVAGLGEKLAKLKLAGARS